MHVRFSDCDMLGHMNNARFISFYEEARVAYMKKAGELVPVANFGNFILLSISCRFISPARFGEELHACARVAKIGNSSVEFEQALFRRAGDGFEKVAEGTAVVVAFDYAREEKVRVSDAIRAGMKALEATVGHEVAGA
jgi:acyl-CoA thioester hydrolase